MKGPHYHIQTGFSLIELLVVLFITGLIIGVATLSAGVVQQRQVHAEADRLRLLLQQGADQALFKQSTLGWFMDNEHYQMQQLSSSQQWQAIEKGLYARYSLESHMTLSAIEVKPKSNPKKPPKINSTEETYIPHILFLPNGQYTPFKLVIKNVNTTHWLITGDGLNSIKLSEYHPDDTPQ